MTAIIEDYAAIKRRMDELNGVRPEPLISWDSCEFDAPLIGTWRILTPEGRKLMEGK